jgi:hypothetical protein
MPITALDTWNFGTGTDPGPSKFVLIYDNDTNQYWHG